MATGYIRVQVSFAKEAMPVQNCKVTIRKFNDEDISFEKVLYTNISGIAETIALDAPAEEFSQTAQNKVIPYKLYTITAEAEGYIPTVINGVQIFPNVTALQKIEMFLKNPKNKIKENILNIPPHQLTLSEPRNKQVGPKVAQYLLKETYIPKYITVHLGEPNEYAEDVTVAFPEYIKNVACSEIYPTWRNEALKANIRAQVSFALNRVYTSWYRDKGYSFEITNSKSYDQCFELGRNYFTNVSQMVDDIFNQYISKIGLLEPLFATFCNGITVTCNGLSQWGSLDLAIRGYDGFGILQHYYGYDISLIMADNIEGMLAPYPGNTLMLNSKEEDVKIIQLKLNEISNNYTAIPKIPKVDGFFDVATEKAVIAFQNIFNLIPDGIVGRSTWNRIYFIYAAVLNLEEVEALSSTDEYKYITLKEGSTGDEVKLLQYYLLIISNIYNEIPKVKITGVFDEDTKNAVLAFQKYFNMLVDGIVGRNTWEKLIEIYYEIESTFPKSNKNQLPSNYMLKEGSIGDEVRLLQYHLAVISDIYPTISKPKITGVFDAETKKSVLDFQRYFGLDETGNVDYNTWNKIQGVFDGLRPFKKE